MEKIIFKIRSHYNTWHDISYLHMLRRRIRIRRIHDGECHIIGPTEMSLWTPGILIRETCT